MSSLRWCVALLLCVGLAAGEIKNKGWWRNTVFYQVYPRSFMDANGDGIGDLKGITSKLEHFKESGIGAIWLSPIYASPMVDFGYDIEDFYAIDKNYGTMADLEELTTKAKALGIKVIMDLVPNHTSDKCKWFIDSFNGNEKYKDFYIWKKGLKANSEPPNNWISVFSKSAWTFNGTRGLWYFHQFEYRQPDLNYANDAVKQEMENVITFWLDKGIDGFRIDAVPHIYERDDLKDEPRSNDPNAGPEDYTYLEHPYTKDDPRTYDLVKSWRDLLDKYADKHNQEEKVIMTEAYTNLVNTTKFYNYGAHVPFNFNFIMEISKQSTSAQFKQVIENWMKHTPKDGSANWVMGNHDRARTATRFPGRADQMTMLAMILPGVAVTYNGEEIAMEDKRDISWDDTQDPQACNTNPDRYQSRSRDPNRTPFQWDDSKNSGFSKGDKTWLPVHENFRELNLKKQKSVTESHYNLYRSLTSLRTSSESLKSGSLNTDLLNGGDVLAIVRKQGNESVILLINFKDDKSQTVNLKKYLPQDENVTVHVSSVGSKIPWKSSMKVSDIKLPAKASVVLVTGLKNDQNENNGNNGGVFSVAPMNVILGVTLLTLFKLM